MKNYFLLFFCLSLFIGCVDEEEQPDTPEGNFEALWKIMDEHYCFFDYKNVDWNSVYNIYKVRARGDISREQLFEVLTDMLSELRDGHVNLFLPLTTDDTGDGTRTTLPTSATPCSADT